MNAPATPLKIGQVHALLRREHPNLELSKIRYYEEMGLVAPGRSRKGYRLYSEKDVACLREAIRLADEEFVPLRVIRVRLIEQGLLKSDLPVSAAPRHAARSAQAKVVSLPVPSAPSAANNPPTLVAVASPNPTASSARVAANDEYVSVNQLLLVSGVEPDLLNKILSLSLVSPVSREGLNVFDALDVHIVQSAATLLRNGADARLLGSLRRVVERQVGILEDLTADLREGAGTVSEVSFVKRDVARDVESLRAGLWQRALDDFLES